MVAPEYTALLGLLCFFHHMARCTLINLSTLPYLALPRHSTMPTTINASIAVLLLQLESMEASTARVLDELQRARSAQELRLNYDHFIIHGTLFKRDYRFDKAAIPRLLAVWRVPETITLDQGTVFTGAFGVCVLLRRMAYPSRLTDLSRDLGRSADQLSRIFRYMVKHVHTASERQLRYDTVRLTDDVLRRYAAAIEAAGAPLRRCIGFVDGTVRPVCRPTRYQRELYNGHKRVHALKYQGVMAPDGIIIALHGPFAGCRHDAYLWHKSELQELLADVAVVEDVPHYLYGDPAYPVSAHLQRPFKGHLTAAQQLFNKRMSAVRISVEWGFGKVVNLFRYVDYKAGIKVSLTSPGLAYKVAVVLANAHTCLEGSQVGGFFGLAPPTLEELYNVQ